jgi:DNA gyrase/topoisomerase IV subunit B
MWTAVRRSKVNAIKQIIGLKHDVKCTSLDQLRYGRVLILSDSDLDGNHVKGLLLNVSLHIRIGIRDNKGNTHSFTTLQNTKETLLHNFELHLF